MENHPLLDLLNHLIETCHDAEKGYQTAAECAQNFELKQMLESYSNLRGRFVRQLQAEVERLGGTPQTSGSVAGALWRGWTNLKSTLTGGNEAAILTECQRAEEAAKETYETTLQQSLLPEIRAIVERQATTIQEALERLHALEEAAAKLKTAQG